MMRQHKGWVQLQQQHYGGSGPGAPITHQASRHRHYQMSNCHGNGGKVDTVQSTIMMQGVCQTCGQEVWVALLRIIGWSAHPHSQPVTMGVKGSSCTAPCEIQACRLCCYSAMGTTQQQPPGQQLNLLTQHTSTNTMCLCCVSTSSLHTGAGPAAATQTSAALPNLHTSQCAYPT